MQFSFLDAVSAIDKENYVPTSIEVSAHVREVLDTFRVAAELGSESFGAYVISMASNASDVLAGELLQKDARLTVSGELGRTCAGGTLCDHCLRH
ncbi:phosphoenolpyruvate carboxylase 4-like [Nymphaea colorata]|uniref:phosphoenolpyruvate carboxylase 4-like n=1 Tax=Nymphaea colorata TaxID=210225 RepID=UPI00129DF495|nr:phosphoenolpyruvate carboxylase 4-like [Nymphaea colorata]